MELTTRFTYDSVNYDQENNVHLVLSLKAPKVEVTEKRPPIYIHVVLDVSGSMSGPKLDYAKRSIFKLLEHMQAGDFVGITTFDDNITDVSPPVELSAAW